MIIHKLPRIEGIWVVEKDGYFQIEEMATPAYSFSWPFLYSSLEEARKAIETELISCYRRHIQRNLDFSMAHQENK